MLIKDIQNFINEYFDIKDGTSAPILITLFVFIAGLLFQRFIATLTAYKRRKLVREVFKSSIETLSKQVDIRSKDCEKTANNLSFESGNKVLVQASTIFPKNFFENIGMTQVFEAYFTGFENQIVFFRNKKIKAFNKLWTIIYAIERWQVDIGKRPDIYIGLFNRHNERRNSALGENEKIIDGLRLKFRGRPIESSLSEFLTQLDGIYRNWIDQDNRTQPDIMSSTYTEPMLKLCSENLDIPVAIEIRQNLMVAYTEFQNQKNAVEVSKEQYFKYQISFKMASKLLPKALYMTQSGCFTVSRIWNFVKSKMAR